MPSPTKSLILMRLCYSKVISHLPLWHLNLDTVIPFYTKFIMLDYCNLQYFNFGVRNSQRRQECQGNHRNYALWGDAKSWHHGISDLCQLNFFAKGYQKSGEILFACLVLPHANGLNRCYHVIIIYDRDRYNANIYIYHSNSLSPLCSPLPTKKHINITTKSKKCNCQPNISIKKNIKPLCFGNIHLFTVVFPGVATGVGNFLLFFIFRSLAVVRWPFQVLRTASTKPQDSICGDHREGLRLHDLRKKIRWVDGERLSQRLKGTMHEPWKWQKGHNFPLFFSLKGVEPNCTW